MCTCVCVQAYILLLYFALLHFTYTMFFLQIEALWQPYTDQVYLCRFPAEFSAFVFVSHFGNSQHFKFFHYYYIYDENL